MEQLSQDQCHINREIDRSVAKIESFNLGPLAISRNETDIPIPDIINHLKLLALNDRPDADRDSMQYVIGIQNTDQSRTIKPHERVYLGFSELDRGKLYFEDIPSPIWIRLDQEDQGVILEVGLDVIDEMGDRLVESRRYYPMGVAISKESVCDLTTQLCAKYLMRSTLLNPDQLYEKYGDDAHRDKQGKYRLQIDPQNEQDVIFISFKEPLFFREGRLSFEKGSGPVVQLMQVEGREARFQVWSENGLEKTRVSLNLEQPSVIDFNFEDVIKRIRKRTGTSISCLLGNKNTLLKKGDWVLHTKLGWKIIKTPNDFNDYLTGKLIGELFVFDALEKREGQSVVIGNLFDKTRSISQQVALNFSEKKKRGILGDTKKEFPDEMINDMSFDDSDMEFDYFDFDF